MSVDIRQQIAQAARELYTKRLLTPTGGNLSARCEDNPDEIWITPTGIIKCDLQPDMLVRINLQGEIKSPTAYTASSERRVHCTIYRSRPDVHAIAHTHAPQATLLALTGTKFLPISLESAYIGDIPVVPFILPGTEELGVSVAQALGSGFAVLLQNHGLVVAADSMRRVVDITDIVEATALKLLTCRAMGITPPVLPDEVIKKVRDTGSIMA